MPRRKIHRHPLLSSPSPFLLSSTTLVRVFLAAREDVPPGISLVYASIKRVAGCAWPLPRHKFPATCSPIAESLPFRFLRHRHPIPLSSIIQTSRQLSSGCLCFSVSRAARFLYCISILHHAFSFQCTDHSRQQKLCFIFCWMIYFFCIVCLFSLIQFSFFLTYLKLKFYPKFFSSVSLRPLVKIFLREIRVVECVLIVFIKIF